MTARLLLIVGLLLLAFDVARLTMSGIALLGTLFLGTFFVLSGVFTRESWVSDDPALAEVDAELTAAERERRRS